VDDTKVNLLIGEKLLNKLSCQVIVAKNGQEAIDKIKNSDAARDLILMDLEMPEVGGLQAAKLIREEKLSYAPI